MKIENLFEEVKFKSGRSISNRFMLAPMTNLQSYDDGTLSEDEYKWLTMRAEGGYGLTMTCAAHVQKHGQGFPGQLGVFSDEHIDGLSKLAQGINKTPSLSILQLHHAGIRSPEKLIGKNPVAPSGIKEAKTGILPSELSTKEVQQLVCDFVAGAKRSEKAGFHGVEIHGAHGYILTQFLSETYNQRKDQYGGSFEGRSRVFFEIIDGIRKQCTADMVLGVRLSPEMHGLKLEEVLKLTQLLIDSGKVDFLDISLWDVYKTPKDYPDTEKKLIAYFKDLQWNDVKFVAAGKIYSPKDAVWCLEQGADFIALGKMGILHHDYPEKLKKDKKFRPVTPPVSEAYLREQGLGPKFINYMGRWDGFIKK